MCSSRGFVRYGVDVGFVKFHTDEGENRIEMSGEAYLTFHPIFRNIFPTLSAKKLPNPPGTGRRRRSRKGNGWWCWVPGGAAGGYAGRGGRGGLVWRGGHGGGRGRGNGGYWNKKKAAAKTNIKVEPQDY